MDATTIENEADIAKALEIVDEAALQELEPEADAMLEADPELEVEPEAPALPDAMLEADPESEVEPEAPALPELEADPMLEADLLPEAQAVSEAETIPELISELDQVLEPDPMLEPDPAFMTEPKPEAEMELMAEPPLELTPEPPLEPEPEYEPEPEPEPEPPKSKVDSVEMETSELADNIRYKMSIIETISHLLAGAGSDVVEAVAQAIGAETVLPLESTSAYENKVDSIEESISEFADKIRQDLRVMDAISNLLAGAGDISATEATSAATQTKSKKASKQL